MREIPDVTFDVIFVRHGVSCANMWKAKKSRRYTLYRDPELTEGGIERSLELAVDDDNANGRFKNLDKAITKYWGPDWKNNKYIICSSPLIRAFQTAYIMMPEEEKIHIIPAVSEISRFITTPNNNPLPFKPTLKNNKNTQNTNVNSICEKSKNEYTQRKILCDIGKFQDKFKNDNYYKNIILSIETDYRDYAKKKYKNSIDGLKSFLQDSLQDKNQFRKILDENKISSTKTIRLIIFTHSHFLLKAFPDVKSQFEKGQKSVLNNEGIHTTFKLNNKPPTFDAENDYIYYHADRQAELNKVLDICPDKCREKVSNRWIVNKLFGHGSPCKKYNPNTSQIGGTRKKSTRRI